jgi:hypothetical protein
MKRALLAAAAVSLCSAALASGNFTAWAGYSYSSLGGANARLDSVYSAYNPRGAAEDLHAGVTAGVDGAYWYYSWWGLGARLAFTKLAGASVAGEEGIFGAELSAGGSLCQAMAGFPLLFEFFDGAVSAGGGLYAGWGYAALSEIKTGGTPGSAGEVKAGAHCFVLEAPVRVTWHISSSFLFDLNFSFRWADAKEPAVHSATGGYAALYQEGSPLGYGADFSGFFFGGGFNWRFSSKDWPWYEKKWAWGE